MDSLDVIGTDRKPCGFARIEAQQGMVFIGGNHSLAEADFHRIAEAHRALLPGAVQTGFIPTGTATSGLCGSSRFEVSSDVVTLGGEPYSLASWLAFSVSLRGQRES